MVPPCSDRVSRAPPYSRTDARPYPYGAVTRSGAPFQALPVRGRRPLAWSAFARRYWRSRGCFPFLRLVRYFSSPGSPHAAMDSPRDTAQRAVGCPIRRSRAQRALAPPPSFSQRATSFIASRCQGIHPMPFLRSSRARPAPSPRLLCGARRSRSRRTGRAGSSRIPMLPVGAPHAPRAPTTDPHPGDRPARARPDARPLRSVLLATSSR